MLLAALLLASCASSPAPCRRPLAQPPAELMTPNLQTTEECLNQLILDPDSICLTTPAKKTS